MSDGTGNASAAPLPENYEGRLTPDQRRWIEHTLKRPDLNIWFSPVMLFSYLTVWQAIRLWRGHIDSEWLLLVSPNLVPLVLLLLLFLWIERRQRPRVPRRNRMLRELRHGTLVQGEGELMWRNHTYAPMVGERTLFAPDATIRDLLPGHYRFFYLPETGLLVAAEALGEPVPHHDLLLTLAHAQGFSAATLAANRAGEAREERAETPDSDSAMIALLSVFAGMFLVLLVLATFVLTGPVTLIALAPGSGTLLVALITLVLAIPVLVALPAIDSRRVLRLLPSPPRDVQHVLAVEGIARKSVRDADYLPLYTLEVAGRQFAIQKTTYFALDASLPYRVYYLPKGNRLLSIEPLASGTAPAAV
ncbi:MAG: hypothetical protein ACXWQR_18755 [Ktedonobacterales bacterium]